MPAEKTASTAEKGHGRRERRAIRTTTLLTRHHLWAGLTQGFCPTRERTVKGKATVEVVYGITSLSASEASPARLAELLRGHWQIENGLHYVRDVTLGEDACRVRRGSAPQVLASLRNAVVHLLGGVKAASFPAALERFAARPEEAQAMIGIGK